MIGGRTGRPVTPVFGDKADRVIRVAGGNNNSQNKSGRGKGQGLKFMYF
jgi:hypothetical protein